MLNLELLPYEKLLDLPSDMQNKLIRMYEAYVDEIGGIDVGTYAFLQSPFWAVITDEEKGSEPVGFFLLAKPWHMPYDKEGERAVHPLAMYLKPDYRGKGHLEVIARKLFHALDEQGFHRLQLRPDNTGEITEKGWGVLSRLKAVWVEESGKRVAEGKKGRVELRNLDPPVVLDSKSITELSVADNLSFVFDPDFYDSGREEASRRESQGEKPERLSIHGAVEDILKRMRRRKKIKT